MNQYHTKRKLRTQGDTRFITAAALTPKQFHTTYLKATNDRYHPYKRGSNERGGGRGRPYNDRGNPRGRPYSERGNPRGRGQFRGGRAPYNPQQAWHKSEQLVSPRPLGKIDKEDAKKVATLLMSN